MTETLEMFSQCWRSHGGRQELRSHQRVEEKAAGLRSRETYCASRGTSMCPGRDGEGKEEGRAGERPEVRLLGPSDDLQKRQLLMKPQHGHLQTQPKSHQVLESSQKPPGPHHAP